MDAAAELSEFLTTRRANLTPEQVLPTYGTMVQGLPVVLGSAVLLLLAGSAL